jgi:hypothetical protein
MKVGRGLLDLMSKSNKKRISRRHRPVLYAAAPIVLALILALTGCGDISLSGLLVKQAPGELGIIPQTATISPDSSIEISGKGGFTPYTFSATYGSIAEIDGVTYYTASATSDEITVVDALSNAAKAIIDVKSPTNPFSFPEAMTIAVGESTGYVQAADGTPPYTFELVGEGTLLPHPITPDSRVKYVAPAYVPTDPLIRIRATDDNGKVSTLEVTVVAAGSN